MAGSSATPWRVVAYCDRKARRCRDNEGPRRSHQGTSSTCITARPPMQRLAVTLAATGGTHRPPRSLDQLG